VLRKLVESESLEVEGRRYAAHYFEYRTARGARRYSCEIMIGGGERIIIDDDSLASLATRVTRLAPEVVHSRSRTVAAKVGA
jgi:hypothetical protein